MTLFFLLIVVLLDVSRDAPGRRVWLGPLVAGVFFLKGMAILMPLLVSASMVGEFSLYQRREAARPALGCIDRR